MVCIPLRLVVSVGLWPEWGAWVEIDDSDGRNAEKNNWIR